MKEYISSCKSDFWQKIFEEEIKYLTNSLDKHKKILSIGCGPGNIEYRLQKHGFDITGMDISKKFLKEASKNVKTIVGSAETTIFNNNEFDAVIYIVSLQFIENYEKAIEETKRIVKPKGKVVILLLNPFSEFFKTKRKQKDSYINNIKNENINKITKTLSDYFTIDKKGYYLGVKKDKIFKSKNKNSAILYIIEGVKE